MSKVSSYVNNMFCGLPKTKQVVEVKLGMIENMEEKYQALLDEGKSENEAFGIVVSDFGSMEELCEEMGWRFDTAETTVAAPVPPEPEPVFSLELIVEYDTFRKKFIRIVALGAALLMVGLGAIVLYVLSGVGYYDSVAVMLWVFFVLAVIGAGYLYISYKKQDMKYWERLRGKDASSPYLPYLRRTNNDAVTENVCGIIMLVAVALSLLCGLASNLRPAALVFLPMGLMICCIVIAVRARGKKTVISEEDLPKEPADKVKQN